LKNFILSITPIFAAFFGAVVGVAIDRIWQRAEAAPLFRVDLGWFIAGDEEGMNLSIENVGLKPLPDYEIALFHPQRGSLFYFRPSDVGRGHPSFPQHPSQKHEYKLVVKPSPNVKQWFHQAGGKEVTHPSIEGFTLRFNLMNSDKILFDHGKLGNQIAQTLYERSTGSKMEKQVEPVHYISKAPFWNEFMKKRSDRRLVRQLTRDRKG